MGLSPEEAAKVLQRLPAKAVEIVPLNPGDSVVVECETYVSQEMIARIHRDLSEVWPGRRIVILDKTMKIKIVRESDVPGGG